MTFSVSLGPEESCYIEKIYGSGASCILEYGSGGSTILALEQNTSNTIYSVETDAKWLCNLTSEICQKGLQSRFLPVYADIGKTALWGHPDFSGEELTLKRVNKILDYTLKPWKIIRSNKADPSIVMIDGRFRVACFISSLAMIRRPTKIIIDDYRDRPYYSAVETIMPPSVSIGRMGVFEAVPGLVRPDFLLLEYLSFYIDSR